MKWLNKKGLVICVIVFILLYYFLDNLSNAGGSNGGAYNIIKSIQDMMYAMEILKETNTGKIITVIKGSTIIAFLISLLIYLTIFLKKKK